MKDCPRCKGKGVTPVSVTTVNRHGNKQEDKTVLQCQTCKGKGKVTTREHQAITDEANIWCQCEDEHEWEYHPDGNSMVYYGETTEYTCSKHHYTCTGCGRITQIG